MYQCKCNVSHPTDVFCADFPPHPIVFMVGQSFINNEAINQKLAQKSVYWKSNTATGEKG